MGMGTWKKRLAEHPRHHETISLKNNQELQDSSKKRCNIKACFKDTVVKKSDCKALGSVNLLRTPMPRST